MSIDDETLCAYVDGELDGPARSAVEAALAADPALARRAQAQKALRLKLGQAYDGLLEAEPPERLLRAVEAAGAAQILPFNGRRRRAGAPRWMGPAAMAASLAVGLVGGALLGRLGPQPLVRSQGGVLQAQGVLAATLERSLASQPARGPIRIGLSFRAQDGRYCRTFLPNGGAGLAGVACRDPGRWSVRLAMAAQGEAASGGYRMAGSAAPPQVLEAVDAMISGEPLDAAGEARARAEGWKP